MKKYILLYSLILIGCGARKVEKHQTEKEVKTEEINIVKNDVEINNVLQTKTKVFTNDSIKEEIEEIENVNTDGSKVIRRKIKRNKAVKSESNTNTQLNEKTTDKTITDTKKQESTKESKQTKNIDRKQFDIIGLILSYWWLWILIILFYLVYRKFKGLGFL